MELLVAWVAALVPWRLSGGGDRAGKTGGRFFRDWKKVHCFACGSQ